MKKNLFLIAILSIFIALPSCKNETSDNSKDDEKEQVTENDNSDANLQVLYFHGTNRCATCNAVEDNAKALLKEEFSTEMENGTITFQSLNFEEEQNQEIVEKYLVSYSTLLLVKGDNVIDMTDKAFKYAKNEPETYKKLLKGKIDKNI